MAYTIAGTYVAACNCRLLCPCPVDGTPTGPDDTCTGSIVFSIRSGNLDGVDLGGVNFTLYNFFPSNLTAGNWKAGVVIDDGASDDQAQAIERIMSGEEGGPFADFAPLIGDFMGVERAGVSFSGGDSPSYEVSGKTKVKFEPMRGVDGSPTTSKNAMFGFAPEYQIGRASGQSNAFGLSYEASYGEAAEFEFSSEGTPEVRARA
jgi:hypothetical protein